MYANFKDPFKGQSKHLKDGVGIFISVKLSKVLLHRLMAWWTSTSLRASPQGSPKRLPKCLRHIIWGRDPKHGHTHMVPKSCRHHLDLKKVSAVPSNSLADGLPSGAPDTKSYIKNATYPHLAPSLSLPLFPLRRTIGVGQALQ
jgi:hypothetical protein